MSINEGMDQLSQQFKGRDWFYDVGTDQYGRIVVYVKYMCHETLHEIPDKAGGVQVLVHFAASKTATREQFTETPTPKPLSPVEFTQKAKEAQANGIDVGVGQMLDELDVGAFSTKELTSRYLQDELDRLEKICGSRTLQDIFYEIQDGPNAVTNLSARYPEVRKGMEKLYDQYGFDVIYEELDG
jgi:hypothetical protein